MWPRPGSTYAASTGTESTNASWRSSAHGTRTTCSGSTRTFAPEPRLRLEVLARPRVERVPQAVGDEEGADDQPADAEARDDDDVRVLLVGGVAVLCQRPPRGLRRLDTEAEEREK